MYQYEQFKPLKKLLKMKCKEYPIVKEIFRCYAESSDYSVLFEELDKSSLTDIEIATIYNLIVSVNTECFGIKLRNSYEQCIKRFMYFPIEYRKYLRRRML